MGHVMQAKLTIRGTRPFLYHRFWEGAFGEKVTDSGIPGKNPDEWRDTYLATPGGVIYFPPTYVATSIQEGGKYRRIGRKSLTFLIGSTLQVMEDMVLTNRKMPRNLTRNPNDDVYLDVRGVGIGSGSRKVRHIRYRVALSKGWTATCHLAWDRERLDPNTLHSVIEDAGIFEGMGDGRSIGLGRYVIEEWKLIDAEEAIIRRSLATKTKKGLDARRG